MSRKYYCIDGYLLMTLGLACRLEGFRVPSFGLEFGIALFQNPNPRREIDPKPNTQKLPAHNNSVFNSATQRT